MIFNLTNERPTKEQSEAGVIERTPELRAQVQDLLAFKTFPDLKEIDRRVQSLIELALNSGCDSAMIAYCPPYLTALLHFRLQEKGIKPLYSFQEVRKLEMLDGAGHVVERDGFVHVGWVAPGL